jgi:hypothetical protein
LPLGHFQLFSASFITNIVVIVVAVAVVDVDALVDLAFCLTACFWLCSGS